MQTILRKLIDDYKLAYPKKPDDAMKALTHRVWALTLISLLPETASEMIYPVMPVSASGRPLRDARRRAGRHS